MKEIFTREEFEKSEFITDLYPYSFYTFSDKKTKILIRLIFKAFNYGKMIAEKDIQIHSISIEDKKDTLCKIKIEIEKEGKIS